MLTEYKLFKQIFVLCKQEVKLLQLQIKVLDRFECMAQRVCYMVGGTEH